MDVNMPVMDGIEATKSILKTLKKTAKSKPDICHPNIIACSSYDDYDTKLECLNAGMNSFICKPLSKEAL